MENISLFERIRVVYADLSKQQKIVADAILDHYKETVFLNAKELSEKNRRFQRNDSPFCAGDSLRRISGSGQGTSSAFLRGKQPHGQALGILHRPF
jgi:hypothetical protein